MKYFEATMSWKKNWENFLFCLKSKKVLQAHVAETLEQCYKEIENKRLGNS